MKRQCPIDNLNPSREPHETYEEYAQRRYNNQIALKGKTFRIRGSEPIKVKGYKAGDFVPWSEHVSGKKSKHDDVH